VPSELMPGAERRPEHEQLVFVLWVFYLSKVRFMCCFERLVLTEECFA
jgi:hypothetical protein